MVHSKIEGKAQRFLIYHLLHTCIDSDVIKIPHQRGIFVTTDEPTLTHHYYPKFVVNVLVYSLCCTFCVLG